MALPSDLVTAFSRRVTEALTAFRNTNGQCLGLCAFISSRLAEDAIVNKVAIGSLRCNGMKVFEYEEPVPGVPQTFAEWGGHAWIEFPGDLIGEPSLFRTAKAQPEQSNLRRSLTAQGLIDRGAIVLPRYEALVQHGLDYQQISYLEPAAFAPIIGGLMFINGLTM